MPKISRKGDSLTTGHICASTSTLTTPTQSTVYANSILIARITDKTVPHPYPPSPPCADHTAEVNVGSETVYVVGLKCSRIGDSTDAGALTSGSETVFAGG